MNRLLLGGMIVCAISLGIGMGIFTILSSDGERSSTEEPVIETEKSSYTGPKIYLSFASHNEDEFHPDYPNYLEDEATFWEHRNNAIAYAEMLTTHGATYNFQTDWNFLLAVQAFDQGDETTNGKNILRYFSEDLGVEIDPHSHENGGYNLVDVAYLIEQTGVTPSHVVGGFIAGPAEDSDLEYLWNLSQGERYPSATWEPKILWGGGTGQHQDETDFWISGVWNPKDAVNFDEHDPNAPLPIVGHYVSGWEGLEDLLKKVRSGELNENGFYTMTIMLNQADMSAENRAIYEEQLTSYEDAVAKGEIVFATITETYNAWEATQNGEPTILHYTGGDIDKYSGSEESSEQNRKENSESSNACGDGTCNLLERRSGVCPTDCP